MSTATFGEFQGAKHILAELGDDALAAARDPTLHDTVTSPHYIRHPYDQATGRTLLKIGRSNSDVIVRFRNQTRTTTLPEEPILLRIYRTSGDSAAPAESAFHRLLDAADHSRTIGRSAGREWFLTHTKFLDEIARTLSLDIDRVNEGEFDDN